MTKNQQSKEPPPMAVFVNDQNRRKSERREIGGSQPPDWNDMLFSQASQTLWMKTAAEEMKLNCCEESMMKMYDSEMTPDRLMQICEEEALRIDPETAEVLWGRIRFPGIFDLILDPEIREEMKQVDQYCLARNPGSDIWLSFSILPRKTQGRLWEMHKQAFPAGFTESPTNDGLNITTEQWLQIRKDEAMRIDPETAEVDWSYGETFDPYGIGLELSDEERQVGREYFARNRGSDIWVWFGDLPKKTRDMLWDMHSSKLAFPAGLPLSWFGT